MTDTPNPKSAPGSDVVYKELNWGYSVIGTAEELLAGGFAQKSWLTSGGFSTTFERCRVRSYPLPDGRHWLSFEPLTADGAPSPKPYAHPERRTSSRITFAADRCTTLCKQLEAALATLDQNSPEVMARIAGQALNLEQALADLRSNIGKAQDLVSGQGA